MLSWKYFYHQKRNSCLFPIESASVVLSRMLWGPFRTAVCLHGVRSLKQTLYSGTVKCSQFSFCLPIPQTVNHEACISYFLYKVLLVKSKQFIET